MGSDCLKISAKSRYALAALTYMGQNCNANDTITVLALSEKLGISKIYLEQVFSLLRRGDIVISIKGAQGGYRLAKSSSDITVFDILSAIEMSMFEKTESTVAKTAENIERVMFDTIFDVLDKKVREILSAITLEDIVKKSEQTDYMYYL